MAIVGNTCPDTFPSRPRYFRRGPLDLKYKGAAVEISPEAWIHFENHKNEEHVLQKHLDCLANLDVESGAINA